MGKYLTLTDAKDDEYGLHRAVFNIEQWTIDLGAGPIHYNNIEITIDMAGYIGSDENLHLNFSGKKRLPSTFMSAQLSRLSHCVDLSKFSSEYVRDVIQKALPGKWSHDIWNAIWRWMKPRLNEQALHAHYLIPVMERRGDEGYNFLLANPYLCDNLINDTRFVGYLAYKKWLKTRIDASILTPWDRPDYDWAVNAFPEAILNLKDARIIEALDGVRMPANWSVSPSKILEMVEDILDSGGDLSPLKNTRVLQTCFGIYQISPTLSSLFLQDCEKSWKILRGVIKRGIFKFHYPPAYSRVNVLVNRISNLGVPSGSFSDRLTSVIEQEETDSKEHLKALCNERPNARYPETLERVDGKTKICLGKVRKGEVDLLLKELNTRPVFLSGLYSAELYVVSVNGKIKGLIPLLARHYSSSAREYFMTIGKDDDTMSKHWKSRAKKIWKAYQDTVTPTIPKSYPVRPVTAAESEEDVFSWA